ncbi:unnamed protein product [Allacma fusca]|uniref:Uncharacterized protein n=1 Tax=Allacma fusca TaxID=39272 RepID=A0A8J2J5X7_9HEXA|nr:unnamed protein product [Allacma fusca]
MKIPSKAIPSDPPLIQLHPDSLAPLCGEDSGKSTSRNKCWNSLVGNHTASIFDCQGHQRRVESGYLRW